VDICSADIHDKEIEMSDKKRGIEMRVDDVLAHFLDNEAAKLPPTEKATADRYREHAQLLRDSESTKTLYAHIAEVAPHRAQMDDLDDEPPSHQPGGFQTYVRSTNPKK
jgi:hypothetical protein